MRLFTGPELAMIVARLEPFSTRIERAYDAPVLYGIEAQFISLSAMELTR